MKTWIGKTIIIVGVIHSVFGFAVFNSTMAEIVSEGLINTVNGQPMREFVFWFISFGILIILFGLMIDWCERRNLKLPKFLGWSLFAFTSILVTIMPISGGWLMFIPAVGLIIKAFNPKPKTPKVSLQNF